MKIFDLVKLINEKNYSRNNLKNDIRGIVVEIFADNIDVLFFNPQNIGDYAIVNVKSNDVVLEDEKLPVNIQKELLSHIDKIKSNAKNNIEHIKIHAYDIVELLVEDNKYSKFGVHKGDRGCVMDNNAVQNYIEVDFSYIDENGKFCGDCISVKMSDLKVVDKN